MDSSILKKIGAESSQKYKELKANLNLSNKGSSISELYTQAKAQVEDISEDIPDYNTSTKAETAAAWLSGISQILQGASSCLAEVGKWNTSSGTPTATSPALSLDEQKSNLEEEIKNYDTKINVLSNEDTASEYATTIKNELVKSSDIATNAESNIQSMTNQIEQLNSKIGDNQTNLSNNINAQTSTNKAIESSNNNITKAEEQTTLLTNQQQEAEQKVPSLTTQISNIDAQISQLKNEKNEDGTAVDNSAQISELENKKNAIIQEIAQTKAQIANLQEQITEQKNIKLQAEAEVEQYSTELTKLVDAKQIIEDNIKNNESLKTKLEESKGNEADKLAQVIQNNDTMKSIDTKLTVNTEKIKDYKNELEDKRSELQKKLEKINTKIEKQKQEELKKQKENAVAISKNTTSQKMQNAANEINSEQTINDQLYEMNEQLNKKLKNE